jgi:signal peptidase I
MRSFLVSGESMTPRLVDGERILVEELTPRFASIARGDILVFRHPRNPGRYLVKRVVGVPGETVEIRRGRLFVNGQRLDEWYLPEACLDASDLPPVTLTDAELFVMGDHRADSEDSRSWGPLRRGLVVGRAMLSYWPPSAAGSLR